jgi:adenosylmethionine-8-amino-7-oxononanoate aminotransferase
LFREDRLLEKLPGKVATLRALLEPLTKNPRVKEVRQCGMMAGVELKSDTPIGSAVCLAARKHGLLTRPIVNTIVLMPPLCISDEEMRLMVQALTLSIEEVLH